MHHHVLPAWKSSYSLHRYLSDCVCVLFKSHIFWWQVMVFQNLSLSSSFCWKMIDSDFLKAILMVSASILWHFILLLIFYPGGQLVGLRSLCGLRRAFFCKWSKPNLFWGKQVANKIYKLAVDIVPIQPLNLVLYLLVYLIDSLAWSLESLLKISKIDRCNWLWRQHASKV